MPDFYANFSGYILAFPWGAYFLVLKIIAAVITIVSVAWYVWTVRRLAHLFRLQITADDITEKTLPKEVVAKPWLEIQAKMASMNPADWSVAVMQADAVLDQILKASGYIGDTMGDRLKQVNDAELAAIDDVWRAHKIRNRLAHGTAGSLTQAEAAEAIRGYEKAFRELNYI